MMLRYHLIYETSFYPNCAWCRGLSVMLRCLTRARRIIFHKIKIFIYYITFMALPTRYIFNFTLLGDPDHLNMVLGCSKNSLSLISRKFMAVLLSSPGGRRNPSSEPLFSRAFHRKEILPPNEDSSNQSQILFKDFIHACLKRNLHRSKGGRRELNDSYSWINMSSCCLLCISVTPRNTNRINSIHNFESKAVFALMRLCGE